jgi:hypothetical protein
MTKKKEPTNLVHFPSLSNTKLGQIIGTDKFFLVLLPEAAGGDTYAVLPGKECTDQDVANVGQQMVFDTLMRLADDRHWGNEYE